MSAFLKGKEAPQRGLSCTTLRRMLVLSASIPWALFEPHEFCSNVLPMTGFGWCIYRLVLSIYLREISLGYID
jgi:hypothetical protein